MEINVTGARYNVSRSGADQLLKLTRNCSRVLAPSRVSSSMKLSKSLLQPWACVSPAQEMASGASNLHGLRMCGEELQMRI